MNIYYISLYYKNNHITGANKRYDEIGKRLLNSNGINLHCVVTKNNRPDWCPPSSCIELPPYNSVITRIFTWFLLQLILLTKEKSILINDFMPFPVLLKLKGHKIFQLIHDLRNFNEFKRGGLGIFTAWFQKIQLKLANQIITVSDFTAESIVDLCNINRESIITSYNGIVKSESSEFSRDIDVLYVATFETRKNHINLIKAIQLIDVPLNIVFVGSDLGLRKSISDFTKKVSQSTGHKFNYYDQLSEQELIDIYARSKVFCSTSFYEGFGIPIIEAILYGCNVTCSDIAVFREITFNKSLYFNPRDVSEVSQCIKSILSTNEPNRKLIELVAEEFDWDIITAKLINDLKR